MISYADSSDASSYVVAWTLRDALQSTFLFWREMPSVSEIEVISTVQSSREFLSTPAGSQTKAFQTGTSVVTCWTKWKSYAQRTAIGCSSDDGRFSASFVGNELDADSFYAVVSSAIPLLTHTNEQTGRP